MSLLNSKTNKWIKNSYSQSGEDLIIKYIFDEMQIQKPTYIDVGAHHPFDLSNTALFYENGSRGINIDPDPNLFKEFLKFRKKDINLNIGIGTEIGEAEFYLISAPALNTFSKKQAENYQYEGDYKITGIITTRINTLGNVLNEYNNGIFPQLLNLDAEGIDELIVNSIDFEKNYPIVMCIETISFSMSGNGIKNLALIDFIRSNGYIVYADTYINTIFVRGDVWQKQPKK